MTEKINNSMNPDEGKGGLWSNFKSFFIKERQPEGGEISPNVLPVLENVPEEPAPAESSNDSDKDKAGRTKRSRFLTRISDSLANSGEFTL